MGAINLGTKVTEIGTYKTINIDSIIEFLGRVKKSNSDAPCVHIILEQIGYLQSEAVKLYAKNNNIQIHYLPAYSPNQNPIEKLWKVANELY